MKTVMMMTVIKVAAGLHIGTDTVITHRVVFKCIGTTKELCYQERLAKASQLIYNGEAEPEPDNAVDSKAIIFQCKLDGAWVTIGYVCKKPWMNYMKHWLLRR